MGFRGLILSDSMNMGAMRKNYAPGEAAVLALKAGVDVVMLSEEHYDHDGSYLETQKACIRAVEKAIVAGILSPEEIEGKIGRILRARMKCAESGRGRTGAKDARNAKTTEAAIAEEACALLADEGGIWPVPDEGKVLYVNATPRTSYPRVMNPRGIGPNQSEAAFDAFKRELLALCPKARFMEFDEFSASGAAVSEASIIVLVTEDYPLPGEDFETGRQKELVRATIGLAPEKCVVVGLRSPYEFSSYPGLKTYFCAFSSRSASASAAAKALHEGKRGGSSPVRFRKDR
jgi:beta-N-acetylhexosaminidase